MELRHIRYFVAAAEEGHFGRAAQRLHISGPALGVQIRELEREVGVELFERLPRGVRLTLAGNGFLAGARHLLRDLQTTVEQAQKDGRARAGILRVAHLSTSSWRGSRLDNLIPGYCVRYPNVDVRAIDLNTADQYAALREGRIDVGIVYAPPETAGGYRSELVDELVLDGVLLPAAHPLTRKNPLHVRDLSVLPLLTGSETHPGIRHLILRELHARGLQVWSDDEHQISDTVVRVGFVAAGVGWMTASAVRTKTWMRGMRGVVFRKWADTPIHVPCCIVWREKARSALVANFVALARELRDGTGSAVLNPQNMTTFKARASWRSFPRAPRAAAPRLRAVDRPAVGS